MDFPSFEWFESKTRELLEKLPEEFFKELNGGVVVEEAFYVVVAA